MKIITSLLLLVSFSVLAQDNDRFYATMSLNDAQELQKDVPNELEIVATYRNEAAVYMTKNASHKLHDRVLVHGPGYIFKTSKEEALLALQAPKRNPDANRGAFTITEDAIVNQVLELIDKQNIETHILELESYGTRYHDRATATEAAMDLKAKWEAMADSYGRTDVSVSLYNHVSTNMPSVIMTIIGAEFPDEYVVVGGHLDSTSNQGNNNAPGADDDASGIATITEATRALFEAGFVPKRTIEVMAYAAEEIGLVGSAEIANEYSTNNIDVLAVTQFDMTNYNGSTNDVSFITDFTNPTLNSFLMSLLDHYNNSGEHEVSYGTSLCNYGCSDHASWTSEGYMAAFPFEANFGQHNSTIHTPNDTFSVSGTADHAAKFAKLCAEFLIEVAKSDGVLGIDEAVINELEITVGDGTLEYNLEAATQKFTKIEFYDALGKRLMEVPVSGTRGSTSVKMLSSGIYIASFRTEKGFTVAKKIVVD
ncbi:MAG: M20/M25/M40 family metallo-hydrolase [Bacteroidota bacterium]